MKLTHNALIPFAVAVAVTLVGSAVRAQHGPGGIHGGGPKGAVGVPRGGPQSGGPRGPNAGGPVTGTGGHGPHADGPKTNSGHGQRGPGGATAPTTTSTTTTTSPIAQRIEQHPQLATRLQALLPPGMTLDQAATGFRNQGQFIAALHVSRNLGIAFADLKTQMVTNGKSLGQSIQTLSPTKNATTESGVAEAQAQDDLDHEGPRVKVSKPTEPRDLGSR